MSTAEELARLGAEWNELFRQSNSENIFLTFGWVSAWWRYFGKGQLAVIAVRDARERLVAVAPLYLEHCARALGARRLGFLGDEHVGSDHLDILALPDYLVVAADEIADLLYALHGEWDYVELRDCTDSPAMTALAGQFTRRGMHVSATEHRRCRYISLPENFSQYLAGVKRQVRLNHGRRWRALQRDHRAECVVISDGHGLQEHFPTLLALHRLRFEQQETASAFLAPHVRDFHLDALRTLAEQQFARMFLLKVDGDPVAAAYGFSVGRTFQFYQCGMHPRWMHYGPGQMLIGHAIEHSIRQGLTIFDFLRGDEPYKSQWASHTRENRTLRFFDTRLGSFATDYTLRTFAEARDLARKARAHWMSKIA
jgi:CelD/BcsL family acetyltransferase involved in cellulose biosynthesis